MIFSEARREVEGRFPNAPAFLGDGVRYVRIVDIPADAEARVDGAIIEVRLPLAHHRRPHQGWVGGAWSHK
jgi:hypothetical protein